MKIDIHCHTTRSALVNIIPSAATLDIIEKEMQQHDIEYTIVLATYFPEHGSGISNYRMLHWLQDKPNFLLFGSLDFNHYFKTGLRELTELAEENHLAGIKIYSGYQEIDYTGRQFQQIASLAARYQLPLMFHGGYIQCHETDAARAVCPYEIAQAVQQFSVPIIISHLAWPFVDELITVARAYDNVFADMSGMLDSYKTPHTFDDCAEGIKRFVGSLGPKRLLFGTDFPVQTHADSIRLIETALRDYRDTDREDVYYHNAKQLLTKSFA